MIIQKRKVRFRWIRQSEGNFTLEGALLFPLLTLCLFSILMLGIYGSYRTGLFYTAVITAERTANIWDNSGKDPVTGSFSINKTDGLYWRIGNDGIGGLFGLMTGSEGIVVSTTEKEQASKGNLPQRKMANAAHSLPYEISGQLSFRNYGIVKTVEVKLNRKLSWPKLVKIGLSRDQVTATVKANIVDPVELIRTVDLIRQFIPYITGKISPQTANALFSEPDDVVKLTINVNSEAEARDYLKALLHGETVIFPTYEHGRSRKVDALDPDGIAHEAKYTVNRKDASAQILKDVELMKTGQVKGIIWHFFRTKKGRTDLNASLRKELEENGIIIIEHE